MNRVSLNARRAMEAASTDEVEVVLLQFEHPALEAPIRLTTDRTERISIEPLIYGTRSTWNGADPASEPYLFVVAAAELPSDLEDAAPGGAIVLSNLEPGLGAQLRAVTGPASVHMAVVLASSPDLLEREFRDLLLVDVGGDAAEIRLTVSRRAITEELAPTDRFTKDRFPGLFR